MEASTTSKSTTQAQRQERLRQLLSNDSGFFEAFFPFFNALIKIKQIPNFINFIVLFYIMLQVVSISLWDTTNLIIEDHEDLNEFVKTFYAIFQLIPPTFEETDCQQTVIIFAVLAAITIILLALQRIYYKITRKFIPVLLYISRPLVEYIPFISIIPLAQSAFFLFAELFTEITTRKLICTILLLVCLVFNLFFSYMTSKFLETTPYLSNSALRGWPGTPLYIMLAGAVGVSLIIYIASLFADWFSYFAFALKFAYNIFMTHHCFYNPFINEFSNDVVGGMIAGTTIMDIYSLYMFIAKDVNFYVYAILLLVPPFVGIAIIYFINKSLYKKRTKCLKNESLDNYDGEIPGDSSMNILESKKYAYFDSLNIGYSATLARTYLSIGIAEMSDLFLDWSLPKYIAERYPQDTHLLTFIVQLISLFPYESRILNVFYFQLIECTKIDFGQKFTLFQVHQIKGLRQSSASSEITEKVMELKHISRKGIALSKHFWQSQQANISFFYSMTSNTERTSYLFKEALELYPNNSKLCEDYATFQIECATDFLEGLKYKNRANLIDQGQNFIIDHSFKTLVKTYPSYIKKGVLDLKGNIKSKQKNMKGTSSHTSSNSFSSTHSLTADLDAEAEEQLGKVSISQHRLRLAYQRAFPGIKTKCRTFLLIWIFISFFLGVVIVAAGCAFCVSIFDVRVEDINRVAPAIQMVTYFWKTLSAFEMYWLKENQETYKLDINVFTRMSEPSGFFDSNSINLSNPVLDEIHEWIDLTQDSAELLVENMISIAKRDGAFKQMFYDFTQETTNITLCSSDVKNPTPLTTNLFSAIIYLTDSVLKLIPEDPLKWIRHEHTCEIFSSIRSVDASISSGYTTIHQEQYNAKETTNQQILLLMILAPTIYGVITLLVLNITIGVNYSYLDKLLKMMNNLDTKIRSEASKPIMITGNLDTEDYTEAKKYMPMPKFFFYILGFLLIAIPAVGVIVMGVISRGHNEDIFDANSHFYYGSLRAPKASEIFILTTMYRMGLKMHAAYLTKEGLLFDLNNAIDTLKDFSEKFTLGADGRASAVGTDSELDRLNLQNVCTTFTPKYDITDSYYCSGLNNLLELLLAYADKIINSQQGSFTYETSTVQMFEILNKHIFPISYNVSKILLNLDSEIARMNTLHIAMVTVIVYITAILMLILYVYMWYKQGLYFTGATQLLRRLSPHAIVSNPDLLEYILGRKSERHSETGSAFANAIQSAEDAVICLNLAETIEFVNASVTSLFGYTPEQLLGQHIDSVLPTDYSEGLYQAIQLMKTGQSALTYECSTMGSTDDDSMIPVHATVLGMTDKEGDSQSAQSFVVIIRDETELSKQKKSAEEAKQRSEMLLFSILPRDIVVRMNRGETDISFSVPSATVIFIDIEKFSNYAATLTPAQTMANLSLIFQRFDEVCQKYPLITKIKLIGDVYMAAAGLFTPDEPPQNHAEATIKFALDALSVLEELNSVLDANLKVRIGINTDGPLIAGVLGTDKPVFDIIGDPINVASRLQSTASPNTIQVSEATYELVKTSGFNIEYRGEIQLKGKGKKKVYMLKTSSGSSLLMNS